MKDKIKITKDNYKEIVLKRGIVTCWILLAICLIIKIFGGNFFNIVCENEKVIWLCNYIDNSWIYSLIAYFTFTSTSLMLLLIIRDDKRFFTKNTLLFWIFVSLYWVFKLMIELGYIIINIHIITVLDLVILFVALWIASKHPIRSLCVIILMYVFTFASVFIKSTGISNSVSDSALVGLIFLLDYYIMLTLTLLYSIKMKKEE